MTCASVVDRRHSWVSAGVPRVDRRGEPPAYRADRRVGFGESVPAEGVGLHADACGDLSAGQIDVHAVLLPASVQLSGQRAALDLGDVPVAGDAALEAQVGDEPLGVLRGERFGQVGVEHHRRTGDDLRLAGGERLDGFHVTYITRSACMCNYFPN